MLMYIFNCLTLVLNSDLYIHHFSFLSQDKSTNDCYFKTKKQHKKKFDDNDVDDYNEYNNDIF